MDAELIVMCLVGFIGGVIFTILTAVILIKKLVKISAIIRHEESE